MKIAYLINTYPRPSHSFIRREIHALERMGWNIHRFAMRTDAHMLIDPADIAENTRTEHILGRGLLPVLASGAAYLLRHPVCGARALGLALRLGGRSGAHVPGTGGRLRHMVYLAEAACVAQRCQTLGIRHLHAHFGTNSTTVALLAEALGGPGFSFTVHGPEEFDAPRSYALDEKIHRSRFAVAVSSFGRSQLCRWAAIADWPKIKVVHCGIEPAHFGPAAPVPSGDPHLVAIGRLTEQKGFPLLVEIMAEAAPRIPGLLLTIVGDGELRSLIDSEIARHGLQERIHIAGWLDEAGVARALADAQALILPSLAEGLPMVVMEAMGAARPVIAASINGVPELLTPDTGWLVPAGDVAGFADAIVALSKTSNQQLTEMGLAGRARVMARHDVDIEAAKLDTLFKATLGM